MRNAPRKNKFLQAGFTVTELMITTGLSLSLVGSVLVGYLATYTSSVNTLAVSKMNQDMTSTLELMTTELRRAGFSGAAGAATSPTTNAFNQVDDTALEVFDNLAANNQVAATGIGTCVVYAYDADADGVVDANELGGFRLNNGVVQMRTAGDVTDPDTCASASNTWTDLTDSDFITVSVLSFDLGNSECLNTREPDGINNDTGEDALVDEADEGDCYDTAPDAGNITVETRQVTITLTANLTSDAFTRRSQAHLVRLRNDLVRVR